MKDAKGLTGTVVYWHGSFYAVFGYIGVLDTQISHQRVASLGIQLVERYLGSANVG